MIERRLFLQKECSINSRRAELPEGSRKARSRSDGPRAPFRASRWTRSALPISFLEQPARIVPIGAVEVQQRNQAPIRGHPEQCAVTRLAQVFAGEACAALLGSNINTPVRTPNCRFQAQAVTARIGRIGTP